MRARDRGVVGVAMALSIACQACSAQPSGKDWWRDAVFYEPFVRSFADSTSGPLAGDGIGDIRGMIERLDYLNDGDPDTDTDLGVTALWLMPIFASPSYHGYDITDYYTINPEYGTNEDFRDLVEACHERGIRVVLDMVINHCSSQHPWFIESIDPDSPKHDWFVWAQTPPTGEGAPESTVWHDRYMDRNGEYYYGFFWHAMPDFNARNPDASAAMFDLSRFWLEEYGVDGYRLDAIRHLIEDGVVWANTPETIEWLKTYNAYLKTVNPECWTVGEIWDDTEIVKRYIPESVDSAFEFTTCFAIAEGINSGNAAPIGVALSNAWNAYDGGRYATFIGNHDMDRLMSRLGGNVEKCKAAATILLTTPGVPFIYYGEEIGMVGTKPDPDIRTPMQWTGDPTTGGFTTGEPWRAVNADTTSVNVEEQATDASSLLNLYKKLIRVRQESPALSRGDLTMLETGDERVLAFVREAEGRRVLVIVNVTGDEIDGGWSVDAGRVGASPDAELVEMLHGAMVLSPKGRGDWRPLGVLNGWTGYAVDIAD